MKISTALLTFVFVLVTQTAHAQVTPDVDLSNPKGLVSIKTDPVLKDPRAMIAIKTDPVLKDPLGMISVNTDPVLKDPRGMISIKTDPVLRTIDVSINDLNSQSIMELIALLEKSGAKVTTRVVDSNGVTALEVFVNGKKLTPLVLQCLDCIEFEY